MTDENPHEDLLTFTSTIGAGMSVIAFVVVRGSHQWFGKASVLTSHECISWVTASSSCLRSSSSSASSASACLSAAVCTLGSSSFVSLYSSTPFRDRQFATIDPNVCQHQLDILSAFDLIRVHVVRDLPANFCHAWLLFQPGSCTFSRMFFAHMFMRRAPPEQVIFIFAHNLVTKWARGVLLPRHAPESLSRVSIVNALWHITLRSAPLSSAVSLCVSRVRAVLPGCTQFSFFLATNLAPQMLHSRGVINLPRFFQIHRSKFFWPSLRMTMLGVFGLLLPSG